jgi:hypothetical protein
MYKIGDVVICLDEITAIGDLTQGKEYEVYMSDDKHGTLDVFDDYGRLFTFVQHRFRLSRKSKIKRILKELRD